MGIFNNNNNRWGKVRVIEFFFFKVLHGPYGKSEIRRKQGGLENGMSRKITSSNMDGFCWCEK